MAARGRRWPLPARSADRGPALDPPTRRGGVVRTGRLPWLTMGRRGSIPPSTWTSEPPALRPERSVRHDPTPATIPWLAREQVDQIIKEVLQSGQSPHAGRTVEALGLARKQVVRLCVERRCRSTTAGSSKTLFVRSVTAAGHRLPAGGADARGRGHVGADTGGAWPAPPSPSRGAGVPGRRRAGCRAGRVGDLVDGPAARCTSALVWRLDGSGTGTRVAGFRAETGRIPASTMKLVTNMPSALLSSGAVRGAGGRGREHRPPRQGAGGARST